MEIIRNLQNIIDLEAFPSGSIHWNCAASFYTTPVLQTRPAKSETERGPGIGKAAHVILMCS